MQKARNRMITINGSKNKNGFVIGGTILYESKFLIQYQLNKYEMSILIKQKIIENYQIINLNNTN